MKVMIKASTQLSPRHDEYDEYLKAHISGVKRSWEEILRTKLLENLSLYGLTEDDIRQADIVIPQHDLSKYEDEEYIPYCDHFYPCAGHTGDDAAYDAAWLHHQHVNPHHSQHWILIRDSGKIEALEMPKHYVFEMLCDWHSFSLKDPESTAKAWWDKNKDNFTLHSDTKKLVNQLIKLLDEPLK